MFSRRKRVKQSFNKCDIIILVILWLLVIAEAAGWDLSQLWRGEPLVITVQAHEEVPQSVQLVEPHHTTFYGTFYAYNAEVAQTDDTPTITASGESVREGIVANNCLPFGTQIDVEGYGILEVHDRMNSRYGCDVFDIFMWSKKDALVHGKQKLHYRIIRH